jgi:hypothetical protein
MLLLTWRQLRIQAAVALAALVATAIALALTGPNLVRLYDAIAPCRTNGGCQVAASALTRHDHVLQLVAASAVLVVPALIALFWGAPLVARELEAGTFRLVWTQSVTRRRWLTVKLGMLSLASMAVAGLSSLMVTWWFSPIDRVRANRFSPWVFDARDIVPIGYAVFALVLGVTAGLLLQRFIPAMATSLVVFAGARLGMTYWLRPRLVSPAHTSVALGSLPGPAFVRGSSGATFIAGDPPDIPNALVISGHLVDATGQPATPQALHRFLTGACPRIASPPPLRGRVQPGGPADFQACVAKLSTRFHEAVTYQPAGRFWTFQCYETAIFMCLALALAGVCFWSIRRVG